MISALFKRGYKIAPLRNVRGMADYYKPKFSGGDAQPHELGRYIRQLLYTDGEKVLAFTICFCMPVYAVVKLCNKEWREKRQAYVDRNILSFRYPAPERDED